MCTCGSNINGNLCCHDEQAKQTLGLVATSYRDIKSGREFDHYFPKSSITEKIVVPDGTVRDTVDEIEKIVKQYNWQTKAIASTFKKASLPETLNAIWDFFYNHYQYKLDRPEVEELRTPARAWHDRKTGIDCDCYSISISCVLTNLGIKHKFRVTKYGAGWQHIYVIVPVPNSIKNEYWVLDCVLDRFNYEKTYTDKFDYKMENLGIPIAVLNGTADDTELQTILSGADFEEPGFGAISSIEDELGALKKHLVRTRNYIVRNPQSVIYHGGAAKNVKMFNHAIKHWDNESTREQALHGLAEAEHDMNVQLGLAGFDEYDPDEDVTLMGVDEEATYDDVNVLGKVKGKKKFWQAVKNVNKKIVDTQRKVGKKVIAAGKKAGQKIAEVSKKVFKAVVRFNPLTLAARGGFLLVMKTNLFGFAKALYPATISESEAKSKGYSADDIAKAKKAWPGITKIFVKILQGKEDNLKKQIKLGADHYFKKHPLKGVETEEYLGVPGTGVSVTAASSALVASAKVMQNAGLKPSAGKSFMQVITDFFKKNKEKIVNVVKKGAQKIKDRRAAKKAGKSSEDGSSESESPESESYDSSARESGANENAETNENSSTESSSSDDSSSETDNNDGSDENGGVDSTPEKKASSNAPAPKNTNTDVTDEEGFFTKVGNWAKENPGKTAAIAVTAATAITLAVSPKARAFVSNLFGGKKKTGTNGLGGVKRKKRVSTKRKSTKRTTKKLTRYKLK